jgi:hypothetical protein
MEHQGDSIMRTSLLIAPLLLATATLAQAPATVVLNFNGNRCPVGMTAEREAFGRTEWIVSLEDSSGATNAVAQRGANSGVYVRLNAINAQPFNKVRVAVDFAKPVAGVMLVGTKVSESPDLRKTFDLSATEGSARGLSGSLLVGTAVIVTRVHLLGITYADGSKWEPDAGSRCSVKPSFLLPVAAR